MSDARERRGLELSARKRALLEQRLAAENLGGGARERVARRPWPDEPAPLSSGQERVFFHERLLPGTATWHVPVALRVTGPLDAGALEAALGELARRHEVLRTRFLVQDGVPHQAVERTGALALPLDDLSALPAGERLAAALTRARRELRRPFDLASAPLARAALWRLDARDHVFLLVLQHALCDAASLAVLLPELAELYAARVEERAPALAEPELHAADHAAWERRHPQEALADERAYWSARLAGAPRPTALRTDLRAAGRGAREGASEGARAGAWLARPLAPGLGSRLDEAARAHGTTPTVVLASAFAALLARSTGETDVLFGAPVGLRTRTELERVPGFLVNTVALRADVADDPRFSGLVAALHEAVLGALAHRELPFDEVAALTGVGGAGPAALRVLFDHRTDLLRSLAFGEACTAEVLDETLVHTGTAKTDLLLVTESVGGELVAAVEYDTELFDEEGMRSLLARFEVLLSAALAEPACPVGALPLATETDVAAALALRGSSEPLEHASVLAAFRAQVQRTPDAIALEHGEQRLGYAALAERAERLAARLAAHGVGHGDRVGLLSERTPDMIVAHLAILRVGAAYVPLDPTHPPERWRFTLADARACAVLVDEAHRAALPEGPRALALEDDAGPELARAPEPGTRADDPAYVMYTSGSTGRPKGVLVAQRGILRLVLGRACARLGPGTALLQLAPIAFDAATFEIWGALLTGGKLVLHTERVPTPGELERVVRASGVTTLWLTAALFDALVDEAPRALAGVRQVLTGGEALSVRHVRKAYAELPEVELINGYGPTECTTFAACHPITRALPADAASVPIGRPIRNTRAYVLDGRLRPVPPGVPGELYLGGDGLALGYVERPRETAARFVPDPFAEPPGGRLYRTGDRALLCADGTLEFLGRADEQIKLRGFRIEPGEIEAALVAQPGVERALVRAVPDEQGGRTLVAWYVAGAPAPERETLARALRARLPAPLVPAALVRVDAFPRNANGKLDSRALPAPAADDRTTAVGAGEPAPAEPLRDATERGLAELWEGVLGAPPRGRNDDFLAAGGHSLSAAILLARAQQRFGVELRLAGFFEAPTLAGLARLLERARSEAATRTSERVALVRDESEDDAPLAPNQRGLWYLWRLAPEDASYHVAVTIALRGPLDVPALEASVRGLVARHEALRTVYPVAEGEPRAHVLPAPALRLAVDDLRALPAAEREREAARLAGAEARASFDLERGPPLRARLVRTAEHEASLVVVAHHLALDGWSLGLLARELSERYAAALSGAAEAPGRAPALRHRDWARWQVASLAAGSHERDLAHWREELAGVPWRLALPTDRPRPAAVSRRGATERLELADDAAEALRALASGCGATPFMTALAALQVLLARWTRQTDFLIGAPVSGRGRAELQDVIGFFVNVLPLRARLEDDPPFASLLRRVRASVLAAEARQALPFESLVQALRPERERSGAPLQVLFSVRSTGEPTRAAGVLFGAPEEVPTKTAKADLAFTLEEAAGGLSLLLTYDAALFEPATAARLLRQLARVLAGAAARPEERVSALPLADATELARLAECGRGPTPALPREGSVPALVRARAAERPDAAAVVCGDTTLSYAALERRSDALARRLRARGVARGELVGLCVERSAEVPVLALAILKADAAYLPLDPAWPEARLRLLLRDAGVRTVVAAGRAAAAVPPDSAAVLRADEPTEESAAAAGAPLPAPTAGPDDPAYAIYTSGSTGQPKGVLVPHRAILRLVTGAEYARLGPDTRILALSPLAFDASTFDLWGALCHGGTCVVFPEPVPTPAALARAIERGQVTTLFVTTALFDALIDEAPQALGGLRELCFGGERVSVRHVERCLAALPGLELVHVYGPTESTTFATFHRVSRVAGRYGSTVPIGAPLANTRTLVLDARMQPVATGIPGELWIGGDGLALGYLGDEELTRARFVADPFAGGGARLYRTGDVVRWNEAGELEFLGRDDDQAKIRGHRIEPGEVQAVLERHAGLARVHVGVHADARGDKRLLAWAVPAPGRSVSERELLRELSGRLPAYLVPARVLLLPELPLNANGKVDARALPAPDAAEARAERTEPANELERHLAAIWERVLGVGPIGVHDDFFELGGHSLLGVKLLNEVADVFGQELPLSSLIGSPTVFAQARVLHGGIGSPEASSLVKIQPHGSRSPIFCVCSLGGTVLNQRPLAQRLGDDQPFYGLQASALALAGDEAPSLEEYAAHYVGVMRGVAPRGPYKVGGHSFGGVVAYEIARQLEEQGETVELLFILDSALPNLATGPRDRVASALAFLRGLPFAPAEVLDRGLRDPGRLWRELGQKLRFTRARLRRLVPSARRGAPGPADVAARGLSTADIVEMTGWPENNKRIAARHYQALVRYRPRPYGGRVTLFRSRLHSPFLGLGRAMGWDKVARGGVAIETVPGGHMSILAPPHVDVLARKLRAVLARRSRAAA